MAKIIGNLSPDDDFMHPLGPEPNFNESMYFNFFDPERSLGGFVRLGNRANEGQAEMTVCLFLDDGRVLFAFKRAKISDNDAFDAGGLRFDVVEPMEELRTVYQGNAIELSNPRSLSDPSQAFRDSPKRTISLDLTHRACGPVYGESHDDHESDRPAESQFAKAHYEQHMAVSGTIGLGDDIIAISGFGLRDHSWGPRHWQAIEQYEWLTMNFGPDLGAVVLNIRVEGREPRHGGVIVRNGELVPVERAVIEADYEDNGLYHRAVTAKVETRAGETLEIQGRVRSFIPLRNRRAGLTTHIGEGMTEWTLDGRTGYGLSEFLRQV
ncbi:MAG: DUF7064 domain-containing protein [Myxococcota bacterium]